MPITFPVHRLHIPRRLPSALLAIPLRGEDPVPAQLPARPRLQASPSLRSHRARLRCDQGSDPKLIFVALLPIGDPFLDRGCASDLLQVRPAELRPHPVHCR